jgi:hypothetical protein
MRKVVLPTLIMITSCVSFVALREAEISTPIPDSEGIPVGTRATANQMEYGPSWTLKQRSLPELEENSWMGLAFVVLTLISIFIYMMEYCFLQWFPYSKDEEKQVLAHTMMLLERSQNLVLELRSVLPFMQGFVERRRQIPSHVHLLEIRKVEEECHDRIQNEVNSLKNMMKVNDERHAQFQKETASMKMMMTTERKRHVQLLREVESTRTITKVQFKPPAEFKKMVDSTKTKKVMARSQSTVDSVNIMKVKLKEETVGDPAYMESSVKMGRPRKNYIVGSKPTDEKKKVVPMNKVQVGLAPPPNLKSVRAKVVSWSNPSHRARDSHVKILNEKLDYSKVKAKITLRRKIPLQGDGDKNVQQTESGL